ncbi:uncharacterized protein [Nicotiana tomentosiformis]|uniref:uncharacterized protein n=1 Tax=Nicotiana tomentosiformis TaxID=4098 RepID=UPI00388CC611
MQGLQTPWALPVQLVAAAQAHVVLVMIDDEHRRLERFGRLQPPSFSGAESEDVQGFLDRCHRILRTSGILETSGVLFTTFQFTGAAFTWWAAPHTWQEFSVLFLEKYMLQSRREELHRQFGQLRQDDMTVTQYEMRFYELAHHAVWLVPTNRERIRRFIDGLTFQLRVLMTRDRVSGATFEEVVDIARQIELVRSQERVEREAKRSRGSGGFSGVPSGGQFHHDRGHPYRHAQTTRPTHRGASVSHGSHIARSGQSSFIALPA